MIVTTINKQLIMITNEILHSHLADLNKDVRHTFSENFITYGKHNGALKDITTYFNECKACGTTAMIHCNDTFAISLNMSDSKICKRIANLR